MECISCGARIDESKYKDVHYSRYSQMNYKLYHCDNCDIEFWVPLEFFEDIYKKFYAEETMDIYSAYFEMFVDKENLFSNLYETQKSFLKEFLAILKRDIGGGKVLDVGCGKGEFLAYMRREGFEVFGIDLDGSSLEIGRKLFNLDNLYEMSLDEFVEYAEREGLRFDLITFFEVLEHQVDIKGFVNKVKRILSPRGYIGGSVPNRNRFLGSFTSKLVKSFTLGDFPPHHFIMFSKVSLEKFFENVGIPCKVVYSKFDVFSQQRDILHVIYSFVGKLFGKILPNFNSFYYSSYGKLGFVGSIFRSILIFFFGITSFFLSILVSLFFIWKPKVLIFFSERRV